MEQSKAARLAEDMDALDPDAVARFPLNTDAKDDEVLQWAHNQIDELISTLGERVWQNPELQGKAQEALKSVEQAKAALNP